MKCEQCKLVAVPESEIMDVYYTVPLLKQNLTVQAALCSGGSN